MTLIDINGFVIELGWGVGAPLASILWALWLYVLATFTKKVSDK